MTPHAPILCKGLCLRDLACFLQQMKGLLLSAMLDSSDLAHQLRGMSLQAHSAAQQVLPNGDLGDPLEGAIDIVASCSLAEGLPSIARILADAVKGTLPGLSRPLQVRKGRTDGFCGRAQACTSRVTVRMPSRMHICLFSTQLLLTSQTSLESTCAGGQHGGLRGCPGCTLPERPVLQIPSAMCSPA